MNFIWGMLGATAVDISCRIATGKSLTEFITAMLS